MNRIGTLWRGAAGALVVGLLGVLATPAPASAGSALETTLLTLTNAARAAAGVPAVTLDSALSDVARDWASQMASAGAISHNPDIKGDLNAAGVDWRKSGENVGMGPSLSSIHEALLASPGHFRNIVDPDFNRVGLGVVVTGNTLWIVQNFVMSRSAAAAAPATTAPAPVVTAAPSTAPPTTRAPKPTTTAAPETTTTTSTTVAPAPSTTIAPVPPVQGLPLRLTLMVQQLRALPTRP